MCCVRTRPSASSTGFPGSSSPRRARQTARKYAPPEVRSKGDVGLRLDVVGVRAGVFGRARLHLVAHDRHALPAALRSALFAILASMSRRRSVSAASSWTLSVSITPPRCKGWSASRGPSPGQKGSHAGCRWSPLRHSRRAHVRVSPERKRMTILCGDLALRALCCDELAGAQRLDRGDTAPMYPHRLSERARLRVLRTIGFSIRMHDQAPAFSFMRTPAFVGVQAGCAQPALSKPALLDSPIQPQFAQDHHHRSVFNVTVRLTVVADVVGNDGAGERELSAHLSVVLCAVDAQVRAWAGQRRHAATSASALSGLPTAGGPGHLPIDLVTALHWDSPSRARTSLIAYRQPASSRAAPCAA